MTTLSTLQNRVHLRAGLVMVIFVGVATYFEFVYSGPATLYSIVLWVVVVPMLFAAAVNGVRGHPLYQPLMYGGFIAIGTLQYLDGDWYLLAGLFVLCGIVGLIAEFRNKNKSAHSG